MANCADGPERGKPQTLAAAEQGAKPALASYRDTFRVPIPDKLPDHPRVFCTAADLARIKSDLAAGDAYTTAVVTLIRSQAEDALRTSPDYTSRQPTRGDFSTAAVLAEAYALTGERKYGERCREILLACARVCPTLKTTPARGRFTDSTLGEGSLAVDAAMAYDLIAGAPFLSAEDSRLIERDLLRILGWECGHRCGHMNSSNWRSWALTIVASCGFAIGDRQLIEEAINGVWDPDRRGYLYGIVQQLTHSIFSDGIHWERSMGYTYYTASALMPIMVAAKNSGIDLWHAKLPGLLGPFEGSAPHEEYGPAGNRSIRAFLDAPFYYAFPNGSLAAVGDSGSRTLAYGPIYELAYQEYGDPKYAWLINRERNSGSKVPGPWDLWQPSGKSEGKVVFGDAHDGEAAYLLKTEAGGRCALVANVTVPVDVPVEATGWVKVLKAGGGSAHLRCNYGDQTLFSNRVKDGEGWQAVKAQIPPDPQGKAGQYRQVRLHVFLEDGAGEVLWDDLKVTVVPTGRNVLQNGSFETQGRDGRRLDFWGLVHSPKDVPAGEYDLTKDAKIGISGRHEAGCTLFPMGGFAVLRNRPLDVESTSVNLSFGPYGSGHDHPDRLSIDLYGLDEVLCPDAGSWGYDNPMHLTWANQTIAHNTVTVDEVAQLPQAMSNGIWTAESGDMRVYGVCRLFHSGPVFKAVRATCDTAYPGVLLDRTLCLVDNYVLDVFRVSSDKAHTYDLALHGPGQVNSSASLSRLVQNPFTARGYAHLTDVRRGNVPAGLCRVDFTEGARKLSVLQLQPVEAEMILAKDPSRGDTHSCVIDRRKGQSTVYVSVIEPHRGEPAAAEVRMQQSGETTVVTVKHRGGEDRFTLSSSLTGTVTLQRLDGRGAAVATETATAGL